MLRSPHKAASDRLEALAATLDRLACAYHGTAGIPRDDVPDFPDGTTYEKLPSRPAIRRLIVWAYGSEIA
jgi:hypothetical protein